jgi:hypothetical protein
MANQVRDFLSTKFERYKSATGTNDNDVVIQSEDVSKWDTFQVMSTAGALDVFVSLDGTNYTTAAVSLQDMGATTSDPVVVTAANRLYGFRGTYARVRVLQNGATGVENACLMCSNI